MDKVMQISKSDLAGARDTGNKEFIETTFNKAAQVIKAGGTVHIMQVFSDAHKEISDIIENNEQLDHFKMIFLR